MKFKQNQQVFNPIGGGCLKSIYFKDQQISFRASDVPGITEGQVLIETRMAGICNTDLELFKGYYGFAGVPGHEFVGVIKDAMPKSELIGKRVVGDINAGCGKCLRCLNDDSRHCTDRTVLGIVNHDGVFAEYLVLPEKNIFVVDDSIEDRVAVFAEPLAAALEISQQIHRTHGLKILVMGDGKLGLLTALAMQNFCSNVVLLGKHERKLAIASRMGVATKLFSSDLPPGLDQFDIVVEATGAPDGLLMALNYCKSEGTIVAKTTIHGNTGIDMAKVVVDEISIVGSRCGNLGLALSFLQQGKVDVRPLIEETYSFSQFEQAFEHAQKRDSLKVLISF